jgi:hypothetical protein
LLRREIMIRAFGNKGCVAMYRYQIRIIDDRQRPFLIWFGPDSTYQALSQTRQLARHGDIVEVWRDDECVHREKMGPQGR